MHTACFQNGTYDLLSRDIENIDALTSGNVQTMMIRVEGQEIPSDSTRQMKRVDDAVTRMARIGLYAARHKCQGRQNRTQYFPAMFSDHQMAPCDVFDEEQVSSRSKRPVRVTHPRW